MQTISKEDSITYNQYWINKALNEGHLEFLPIHKLPGKSIGEHIEIKYKQLYNSEFDKNYHNGNLENYEHIIAETPKINQSNSELYKKEWIEQAKEAGIPVPYKKLEEESKKFDISIGELLELKYYAIKCSEPFLDQLFDFPKKGNSRKKMK